MKITVLTLGTRGDVQPYVALGTGLMNQGHEITICTGKTFKTFIESHGIGFVESTLDLMEILKTEEGQAIFNGGGNLLKSLKYAKEHINPMFRQTFDDFFNAAKGSDAIIYHPKAMVAPDIAEYFNIPCISMPPVPMTYPITEFPCLAVSGERNFGSFLNKLTYSVNKYAESSTMKEINDFRIKTLGLSKRKMGAYTYKINGRPIPIIYPVSPELFKDVSSWHQAVKLTGFFYLPYDDQVLTDEITAFINDGPAPIIVSFSSMPLKNPAYFKQALVEALKKTGNRAIVLTGITGMTFDDCDDVLAVEKAPHRLLFKQGKGIIHHGGVGTMAEALLSGKPQVIMPFNVDQPFWAHRLYKKNLALKPLKEKNLSMNELVDRMISMSDTAVIQRAEDIASKMAVEDGIKHCAEYIERIIGDNNA